VSQEFHDAGLFQVQSKGKPVVIGYFTALPIHHRVYPWMLWMKLRVGTGDALGVILRSYLRDKGSF
jgi:hypothetical protein